MRDKQVTWENKNYDNVLFLALLWQPGCGRSGCQDVEFFRFSSAGCSTGRGYGSCHAAGVLAIRYSRGVHYAGARPPPLRLPVRSVHPPFAAPVNRRSYGNRFYPALSCRRWCKRAPIIAWRCRCCCARRQGPIQDFEKEEGGLG